MCNRILLVLLCLSLSACCRFSFFSDEIDTIAEKHTDKLRKHFIGDNTVDVSTLISETRKISKELKRSGKLEQANKFDSYTDVLMYGNHTIDESINDVMELVKHGECTCPTLQSSKTRLSDRN